MDTCAIAPRVRVRRLVGTALLVVGIPAAMMVVLLLLAHPAGASELPALPVSLASPVAGSPALTQAAPEAGLVPVFSPLGATTTDGPLGTLAGQISSDSSQLVGAVTQQVGPGLLAAVPTVGLVDLSNLVGIVSGQVHSLPNPPAGPPSSLRPRSVTGRALSWASAGRAAPRKDDLTTLAELLASSAGVAESAVLSGATSTGSGGLPPGGILIAGGAFVSALWLTNRSRPRLLRDLRSAPPG